MLISRVPLIQIQCGAPVGVEDGGCVATEEGYLLGHTPLLLEGDDGKSATAGSFPIDGDIFGVRLDQVGVPGVLRDAQIIVALFLQVVMSAFGRVIEQFFKPQQQQLSAPFSCSVRRRGL
jgi:hypothetical protein